MLTAAWGQNPYTDFSRSTTTPALNSDKLLGVLTMLPVNKTATVRDDGDLRRMHRNHKMKRKQSRKKRQASAKKEVEEIEHLKKNST